MGKLPEPPEYAVWTTASGNTMHGRRCQATNHTTKKQCEQRAREGFSVCGKHGAGHAARVERGERKDPTTANLKHGLNATRMKGTLRDKIDKAEQTFDAIGAARFSGATTQTLLEEYLEKLSTKLKTGNEQGTIEVSQDDMENLLVLTSQLARTAKHLSDIEAREQLTFEDLMFIAKQLTALFVSLSLGHFHEANARSKFLEDAEDGLLRIFRGAGKRGVVESNNSTQQLVPTAI